MSYKPNEAAWMAYLYGEMEGEERARMELYLAENANARLELENMKALQKMLRTVEDKEVIAPPIVMDNHKTRSLWDFPYAKTIISIAASLLLIMVVGRLTGTSIASDETGIHISFGPKAIEKPVSGTPMLTQAEVQEMINASLSENNNTWQQSLAENRLKIDESIRKNLAANTRNSERVDALIQQVASASKDQIEGYVASLQTENMRMMQDYMKLTSNEQKDYMENLLVDFSKYLQQQRNDDLRLLQTKITDVEQNNNLFKAETEQILTSLISNSGTSFQKAGIRN
jgi:hypothetical protein